MIVGNTCRSGAPISAILTRLTTITLHGWCIVPLVLLVVNIFPWPTNRWSWHSLELCPISSPPHWSYRLVPMCGITRWSYELFALPPSSPAINLFIPQIRAWMLCSSLVPRPIGYVPLVPWIGAKIFSRSISANFSVCEILKCVYLDRMILFVSKVGGGSVTQIYSYNYSQAWHGAVASMDILTRKIRTPFI